jgi:hypothetical protein
MSLMQRPSIPTTPPADHPFRNLLSPLNSDFASAFSTFRAAFQELTLLAWEERLDSPNHDLQKQRAVEKGLEPFVWKRPGVGMGVGDMPALPRVGMEKGKGDESLGMLSIPLPATRVPLSPTSGTLGSSIHRETMLLQKAADEKRRSEKGEMEAFKMKKKAARGYKANQPLFNGVNGRPSQDRRSNENGGGQSLGVLGEPYGLKWA